ncbi:MAG: FtsW/RodA/SpoVE family cell cycle protein [Alphaproteobacteria bacterium GM7ARS4]|nr:FtsW/RodA/SpoVE family cell cycle protein [Alphaproteobacteria bacterium GM7ARS4]
MSTSPVFFIQAWWRGLDKGVFAFAMVASVLGIAWVASSSESLALRVDVERFYFAYRQWTVFVFSCACLMALSMMGRRHILLFSMVALGLLSLLLVAVLNYGDSIHGAQRWITLREWRFQPTELVKPFLIILSAWLFQRHFLDPDGYSLVLHLVLFVLILTLIMAQPDIGQAVLIMMVWGLQCFVAGGRMRFLLGLALMFLGFFVVAYGTFPHVSVRLSEFMNSATEESYQVGRSLRAFAHGGLLGVGMAQGVVKIQLPDAHGDFVFAVIGEEWGFMGCFMVLCALAWFVRHCMVAIGALSRHEELWVLLAIFGLMSMLTIQSIIHMASVMALIPTKGMTLPFLSYGGSSLLGSCVTIGLLLALMRRRVSC